jgi:hypothetical protein
MNEGIGGSNLDKSAARSDRNGDRIQRERGRPVSMRQ